MQKARLDAIQKNKNKFADVQAEGLKEYYENRGGWEKFGEVLVSLLKGAGLDPGNPPGQDDPPDPGFKNNAPVAAIEKDYDFLQEVHKLAGETGSKPSELLAMYNAESGGIKTKAKNKSGATGLFQLMFDPDDPNDKRYGYTREQFTNLSRGDQVRAHRRYLVEAGFFKKGGSGIADVKVANIAPSFLGADPNEPIYKAGSSAYENNKNIDLLFGNSDGAITAAEYMNFINETGNEKSFRKFNDVATTKPPEPEKPKTEEQNNVEAATTAQLGQKISQKFGMEPKDERWFTVPGYGRIKAVKTTNGFDFYGEGFNNKLSMHPSRPQAKAIYDHFIKTNGGQKLDGNEQSSNKLLQDSERQAISNATGESFNVVAITSPQSNTGVEQLGDTTKPAEGSDAYSPGFAKISYNLTTLAT